MHNSDMPFLLLKSFFFSFPKRKILASTRRLSVLSTPLYANTKKR